MPLLSGTSKKLLSDEQSPCAARRTLIQLRFQKETSAARYCFPGPPVGHLRDRLQVLERLHACAYM